MVLVLPMHSIRRIESEGGYIIMAKWFYKNTGEKEKYKLTYKGIVFLYDTTYELGCLVRESGCKMENPYEPDFMEWDDFNSGK